jgi:hypothetical protein
MSRVKTNRVLFAHREEDGRRTVQTKSRSNPEKKYTVDLTNGTCSCPAWIYGSWRGPCKHMKALGFYSVKNPPPIEPGDESVPNPSMNYTIIKKGSE